MLKSKSLYLKATSFSIILISGIAFLEYIEPPSSQNSKISNPSPPITLPSNNLSNNLIKGDWSKQITYIPPSPDQIRISQMEEILKHPTQENYKTYYQLCSQQTTQPQIGMTISQSRQTSWCYPLSRNITKTSSGERVQEVYLKNQNISSNQSKRKYLYFENGILTAIQE